MPTLGKIIFYSMIVLIILFAALIILIMTLTFTNPSSDVISSNTMPIANLGMDELLSCYTQLGSDQTSITEASVTWEKKNLNGIVYRYKDKAADLKEQDPQFKGRTELYPEALVRGNASLLLRGVRQSDEGEYTCSLSSSQGKGEVNIQLRVAAFTAPTFRFSGNSLTAEARRWYPKPNVTWLDHLGKILEEKVNYTESSAGIFSVVSTLQQVNASDIYTFKIENELVIATSRETLTGSDASWNTYFTFNTASSVTASTYLITCILCICYLT